MDPRFVARRRGVVVDGELEKIQDLKATLSNLLAEVLTTRAGHGVSSAEVNPAIQSITSAIADLTSAGEKLVEARQSLLNVDMITVARR